MLNKLLLTCCLFAFTMCACSKKAKTNNGGNSYDVNTVSNVEYGSNKDWLGSNQTLKMNIYLPEDASAKKKYPLLVLAHSGSFLSGTKESIADVSAALAEKGMIVASIDYRLGWDTRGTSGCGSDTASLNGAAYRAMQDFNASLRFLTANADKYYIDTTWIFTGGASAGAVAALNSAYLTDAYAKVRFSKEYNQLGSLFTADNHLTNTYKIKGICSMWGGAFDPGIITASNAFPAIFYHGGADDVVPVNVGTYLQCPNSQKVYGSEYLYKQLTGFGVPAVAHIYDGAGHEPAVYANNPEFLASTAYCFFNALRNKMPQKGMYKQMESNCK